MESAYDYELHGLIPEEWREEYSNVIVIKENSARGNRLLRGIRSDGTRAVLRWAELDNNVKEMGYSLNSHPKSAEEYNNNPEYWDEKQKSGRLKADLIQLERRQPTGQDDQLRQLQEQLQESQESIRDLRFQLRASEEEKNDLQAKIDGAITPDSGQNIVDSKHGVQRRWNRLTGRIGEFMLGRHVAVQSSFYSFMDSHDRRVTIDEDIVDGYPKSSERAGRRTAAFIGAAALLAAGVALGAEYLVNRYTGHSATNHLPGNQAGSHWAVFNPSGHNKSVALELPKNLRPEHVGGHTIIVDNHGHEVVSLLDQKGMGIADSQGKLSRHAMAALRAKHWVVKQHKYWFGYRSIVENS